MTILKENSNLIKVCSFNRNSEMFVNSLNLLIKNPNINVIYNKELSVIEIFSSYIPKLTEKDTKAVSSDLLKVFVDFINEKIDVEDKNPKVQVFVEPVTKKQIIKFLKEEFKNKQFRTEDAWIAINKRWTPEEIKDRTKLNISNILCTYVRNSNELIIVRTLEVPGNPSVFEFV